MLTSGATTHTYYNSGRMKNAKLGSASATVYIYNALGQRIRKTNPSATTIFLYDEAGHLLGEYNSSGNPVQETVWLGDIPVAIVRPNGSGGVDVYYVHTDQLNTPRKVTNSNASLSLRWRWDPTPFGEGVPNESPAGLSAFKYNLRFPGQYFDVESNLNYNYFRDYEPAIGRYAESDPIGLGAGINTYSYVGSNPIDGSDVLGLCKEKICGLKRGPEYDHAGQIPQGTDFSWSAEFLNDDSHDPNCCEVRQLIFWNRCWSEARCQFHRGFQPPHDQPGNWYEDRDKKDKRYGRRDGNHSDLGRYDRYEGNKYFGEDGAQGPPNPGFYLKFRLIVVDRCSGGKTIYTSKTLRVNF